MAQLMGQSRSVLPLRLVEARELESCGGKNVRARLFHLNWPEPVLFGRPERTSGKRPKLVNHVHALQEHCVKLDLPKSVKTM